MSPTFARISPLEIEEAWPRVALGLADALANSASWGPIEAVKGRCLAGDYTLYAAGSGDYHTASAVVELHGGPDGETWANLVLLAVDPRWQHGRDFLVEHLHLDLASRGVTHVRFLSLRAGASRGLAAPHGYRERMVEYVRGLP